jgi:hypothetical protein
LLRRQALVLAVIPFGQIAIDDGFLDKARQSASLTRTLHRAAENEREQIHGEHRPNPLGKPASIVGQDVRRRGVLSAGSTPSRRV